MWKVKHMCVSMVALGALFAGIPRAQAQSEQQESIADAARRSREQKKEAAKPATVITNDTLEPPKAEAPATPPSPTAAAPTATATAEMNATATATPAPGGEQQAAAPAAAPAAGETPEEKTANDAELQSLKQQIKELQSAVDLIQRQVALANDDFYSRPDFAKDDAGKAKLDAMKSDLTEKQDELNQLKAKLPAGADVKEEKPAQSETESQPQSQSQPPPSETQTEQQSQSQPAPPQF